VFAAIQEAPSSISDLDESLRGLHDVVNSTAARTRSRSGGWRGDAEPLADMPHQDGSALTLNIRNNSTFALGISEAT
jgi:hypothetical protein